MNISELYGKKIVSTGGKRGYVLSVNVNRNKIECLICADENEAEFKVDFATVKKFGNELVYEDREHALKAAKPITLGRAGYDAAGKLLGVVEEFIFKGSKLTTVIISKKKYPADRVIIGDAVIVEKPTRLKGDIVKDGKVIIRKGALVTEEMFEKAAANGEYIQANLKAID